MLAAFAAGALLLFWISWKIRKDTGDTERPTATARDGAKALATVQPASAGWRRRAELLALLEKDPARFFEIPKNLETLTALSQSKSQARESCTVVLCAIVNGYGPRLIYQRDGSLDHLKTLLKRGGIEDAHMDQRPQYFVQIIEPSSITYFHKFVGHVLLTGKDEERWHMAEALQNVQVNKDLCRLVLRAIGKERDLLVRGCLWSILRRTRDRSLLPELEERLRSDNSLSRQIAVSGIAAIRGEEACPLLVQLRPAAERDGGAHAALARAAGGTKDDARGVLMELLNSKSRSDWKGFGKAGFLD